MSNVITDQEDVEEQVVIISTGKNIPGIKVYFPGVDITEYYTSYAKIYASGPHGTPATFSLLVKEYGAVDPNLDEEESIAFEAEKKCISGRLKDALAKIADLELQLSQCKAWLDRESGSHSSALDQLSKIEKLVTHDGCGNTYARVAAEIGMLKRKLNDPKLQ